MTKKLLYIVIQKTIKNMKQNINFYFEKKVADDFRLTCAAKNLSHSQAVEQLIKDFIISNKANTIDYANQIKNNIQQL